MGIFSELVAEKESVFIEGDNGFDLEVVGESDYQRHLKSICGGNLKQGSLKRTIAELHYEDKNPRDSEAIRVDVSGKTVGYLPIEEARLYRKKIEKTGYDEITVSCNAIIFGEKKVGLFRNTAIGVWLDLPIEKL
jgi:hypothetical protein